MTFDPYALLRALSFTTNAGGFAVPIAKAEVINTVVSSIHGRNLPFPVWKKDKSPSSRERN